MRPEVIAVKLAEQPRAPKLLLPLPEGLQQGPGGGVRISALKELIVEKLPGAAAAPELMGEKTGMGEGHQSSSPRPLPPSSPR
eukprot:g15183.t1